jgi:immunity protein 52 of polymorphic toxin system
MTERYRVQVYWPSGPVSLARIPEQIVALLVALEAAHDGLGGWVFEDREQKLVPASTAAVCRTALEQAAIVWHFGGVKQTAYRPRFFVGHPSAPAAVLTLTCGIEPIGLQPLFAPNRLELLLAAGEGATTIDRHVIENALRAAVAVFRPDFGHAGSESMPEPVEPIFSDGSPVVGWMTFLSTARAAVPPALPKPSIAYPVGSFGTLIVAHPDLFRDRDEGQLAAIGALRQLLQREGLLVPATTLHSAPEISR